MEGDFTAYIEIGQIPFQALGILLFPNRLGAGITRSLSNKIDYVFC